MKSRFFGIVAETFPWKSFKAIIVGYVVIFLKTWTSVQTSDTNPSTLRNWMRSNEPSLMNFTYEMCTKW